MATLYKGNTAVRETWESGAIVRGDLDRIELVKTGKKTDIDALLPAKGAELLTGYTVETAKITPKKGAMAELRITLVEKDSTSGTVPSGALSSTIEIDMAQLEKPILTKSDYSPYAPEIELWKASSAALRSQYKYIAAAGDEQTLAGEALTVAQLALKGVESYLAFNPVITRVSVYKARPTPANYGKIDTPPVTAPGTWVYLKTGDRIVQGSDKKYTRTEQWTGADEWATELYETAT